MLIRTLLLLLLFNVFAPALAQTDVHWQPQNSGLTASFRGLCAVSDNIVWVSGTRGSFARTVDGGATWQADSVAGASTLDFRDVHAIDASIAYLMSVGAGAHSRIYKTTDGGKSWQLLYTMQDSAGFFDSMAFWDAQNGIVLGDPIVGHLFILITSDAGKTWQRIPPQNLPPVLPGEYAFAASGTCIAVYGKSYVWIGTGGATARVFRSSDCGHTWSVATTPIVSGAESSGIFSLAFRDENNGIAVGGDYRKENDALGNIARTVDGGLTWTLIEESPTMPYRSCVAYVPNTGGGLWVTVGSSGSDYSIDDGTTWKRISEVGYHTMSFGGSSDAGWAAGAEGRIAKFVTKFSR